MQLDEVKKAAFYAECCAEIEKNFHTKVKAVEEETNNKIALYIQQNQKLIDSLKNASFIAVHDDLKLNLQKAFENLRIENADNAKAEAESLKEVEQKELDFEYEMAMVLGDDFSEGKSEEEAEKVVVEKAPPKEKVNPPKEPVIPKRDDLAGIKAFIAENPSLLKPALLEDYLRNGKSTLSKINDVNIKNAILHLIDQFETKNVFIFDHNYREDDALSLAIKFDRTEGYKIINRLVAYLKNPANSAKIPLDKEKYRELANKQVGVKKDILRILEKFCGNEKGLF